MPPAANFLRDTTCMAENKTVPTGASVEEFLSSVEHPTRREDGFALLRIMSEATGQAAVMWGPSIVGFGYHVDTAVLEQLVRTGYEYVVTELDVSQPGGGRR